MRHRPLKHLPTSCKFIQRKGYSTTDHDPGNRCPKCGGYLRYRYDFDDAVFCENSLGGTPDCDFQYSFTDREILANWMAQLREMDRQARKEAAEYVKQNGPPVFGQVRPEQFILPSELNRREECYL